MREALAWLLLGALGPLLIASTVFLGRQWELQREGSINRLRDLAVALQLSVDRELALDQTALRVLATSGAIDARDWVAFYAAAQEAAKLRPGTWVLLGDRSEKTIINTFVPLGTALPEFSERYSAPDARVEWEKRSLPWFDTRVLSEPLHSGRPRISNLFYGPVRKGPVVALSVPVTRHGEVPYALAFAYAPERFVAFLQQQPASATTLICVIDGNGNIIARNRDPAKVVAQVAQPPFDASSGLPREGVVETVTFDGVPVFVAHRRSDLTDWTITVGLPSDEILAPARRSLLLWLALLSGMLGAAIFLAHRFWRRVALPLIDLARQAREIGEHDIDVPPTDIEEVETLRTALTEATHAERARREETAQRLALEQRERLLATQHADTLREADRRKDEFLAMLGHELRNPLAPIVSALAVMRKLGPPDATLQRLQDMMERQTRQLTRLVDDLLDVARINTGRIVLRKERLDLRQIVEQAARAAQAAMDRRGHVLSVALPQEALWMDGDEARLAQILGNLLDNAAKYTEPGGAVAVSLSRDRHCAVLRVSDTGKGIPPDLLPNVFDLFKQGDLGGVRAAGGLGIGLYIVKRLVEKHGGEVSVHSTSGQHGSVFEVKLPLADGPPLQPAHEATIAPTRALRLLVVDDNEDAAESLALLLRLDGHAVRVVHDGVAAIKAAIQDPPDAVLLDLNMPGVDGYEVARRLKAEPSSRDVALIAVSGYSRRAEEGKLQQAGIEYYLTKPVNIEPLRAVLAEAERSSGITSADPERCQP